jgi:hypothetical protein
VSVAATKPNSTLLAAAHRPTASSARVERHGEKLPGTIAIWIWDGCSERKKRAEGEELGAGRGVPMELSLDRA